MVYSNYGAVVIVVPEYNILSGKNIKEKEKDLTCILVAHHCLS